jgi:hypothetical protein
MRLAVVTSDRLKMDKILSGWHSACLGKMKIRVKFLKKLKEREHSEKVRVVGATCLEEIWL